VAGVCHGHPDPLHQRWQHEEGPAAGGGAGTRVREAAVQELPGPHPCPQRVPQTPPLHSRGVREPLEASRPLR
jgi:hypothetical protein